MYIYEDEITFRQVYFVIPYVALNNIKCVYFYFLHSTKIKPKKSHKFCSIGTFEKSYRWYFTSLYLIQTVYVLMKELNNVMMVNSRF